MVSCVEGVGLGILHPCDLQCVEFSSNLSAIVKQSAKYIVTAFLPLTVFFVMVVTQCHFTTNECFYIC